MKDLVKLREMLYAELEENGKKGELSAGSLATVDTLAHALKNLDKVIEEQGYSGYYPDHGSYHGGSYRGRDSMGRYTGYSRNALADKLRDLMADAPDDRTRQEMHRMIEKLENA